MILSATTQKLQIVLGGAKATNDCAVVVDYVEFTATATTPGVQLAKTNGTTAVDILSAPASGSQRKVNSLTVSNSDTAAIVVTIRVVDGALTYPLTASVSLEVGSTLQFTDVSGWSVISSSGSILAAAALPANVTMLGNTTTGTGSIVLSTSPTLTTPNLGTPSALTLTNATGLPVGGISATGTPSASTYLRGDGSWQSVAASPGGSSLQLQYNNAGSFGGMSGTSWDDTSRSLTITGATVTTSKPVLDLSQTWNAAGVAFTGLKFNATDTASASGSLLLDIGVGGGSYVSKFKVDKTGVVTFGSGAGAITPTLGVNASNYLSCSITLSGANIEARADLFLSSNASRLFFGTNNDTILTRAAAATLQHGAADAAAPVAQTIQVQSVVAGTTNTAGANLTIKGSAGTGTGAGGSIIFQVAPAGTTGTAQNAFATALTIASDKSATFGGYIYVAASNKIVLPGAGYGISFDGTVAGALATIGYNSPNLDFYISNGFRASFSGTALRLASAYLLGWSDNAVSSAGTVDTILARDAANTLALKNSTNPQIFRAYSTTASSGSYGYLAAGVTNAGVATADTLFIGTGGAGAAMTKLALVVNGTTRWSIDGSGNLLAGADNTYDIGVSGVNRPRNLYIAGTGTFGGSINFATQLSGSGTRIYFNSAALGLTSGAILIDNGSNANGAIVFNSPNTSNPGIFTSGATLRIRTADNSAFAPLSAELVTVAAGTATPAGGSTAARLLMGTTSGFGIYFGSGAPTVSAAKGSIYLRSDGSGTNDRMYVNTDGATTWTAVTTAA